MKNWIIAAVLLFALFILGLLAAAGAGFYYLSERDPIAPPPVVQAAPQPMDVFTQSRVDDGGMKKGHKLTEEKRDGVPDPRIDLMLEAAPFPPPPSKDGTAIERWTGYYFDALQPFEQVVARNSHRVRFWFDVRRNADGGFRAACNEVSDLGEASIAGNFTAADNALNFIKTYATGASWRYEGKWNAAAQRIEGTYGPNQGGFVLFPRRLSHNEVAALDKREPMNGVVLMPRGIDPVGVPPRVILEEFPPPRPEKPRVEPKNDGF